jgi:AraC-like DNA-binding protein
MALAGMDSESVHVEPKPASTSGVFVRVLLDALRQRGVPVSALFAEGEAEAKRRSALEARMPMGQFQTLIERAIQLTGDPALGLHCGARGRDASFDVMGYIVAHAPTMAHVIDLLRQFEPLFMDDAHLHCRQSAERVLLRCEVPRLNPAVDRTIKELALAGMMRMLRVFGAEPHEIHSVSFDYPQPSYIAEYQRVFGSIVRFDQPLNGIEFSSALLDRPHVDANPDLHAVFYAHAQRSFERMSRAQTVVERVRAYLQSQPPGRLTTMTAVARDLGLSVRSLRRRLLEENASYRELTQEALKDAALRLLREPQRTVQDAAYTLGFADVTAFHRAFKRWTHVTPAEYQQRASARAR